MGDRVGEVLSGPVIDNGAFRHHAALEKDFKDLQKQVHEGSENGGRARSARRACD